MNRIEIETEPNFTFFCPVTGTRLIGPRSFTPSTATVFTYSEEVGDPDCYAPVFELLWEQVCSETVELQPDRSGSPWTRFCEILQEKHPNIGIFTFTERGIANGPYSQTIHIGINFTLATGKDLEKDCPEFE